MRRQGVLDRQGVQVEASDQDIELVVRRLMQADPQVFALGQSEPLIRQRRLAHPLAVLVDVGGDDAHGLSFLVGRDQKAPPWLLRAALRVSTRRGP